MNVPPISEWQEYDMSAALEQQEVDRQNKLMKAGLIKLSVLNEKTGEWEALR